MGAGPTSRRRRPLWPANAASAAAFAVACAAPPALAQDAIVQFDIPAQSLSASLLAFGRQAKVSILASQSLVEGRTAPEVGGELTARQGLARLLSGSNLTYEFVGGGAVRILAAPAPRGFFRRRPTPRAAPPAVGAPPAPEREPTVEALVVTTGTSIRGRETQALPVTVLDEPAMGARNALTPIDLLTGLPQVGAIPLGEATSGSLTARGDNAAINLRGIGSSATLVLLNGRRLAPHPISSTENGAPSLSVNVNQLPTRGLDRIDILRDGASSLYGSDAVAGVVNFVIVRRFEGAEVRARYGYPEEGGGKSWNLTFTEGAEWAEGRGRMLANVDVFSREKIFLNERAFARTADHTDRAPAPFNTPGSAFDGRLANLYPTFRVGAASSLTYFRPLAGGLGFTSVAPSRAETPEAFVDVNRYQEAQPRSTRINAYITGEYDLSRATLFTELTLYRAASQLVRNPVPFNAPNSDLPLTISAANPYNPYGARFYSATGAPNPDGSPRLVGAPQAVTLQSVLLVDGGADAIDVDSQVQRFVGGARGRIGQTWSWEAAALYSSARTVDETQIGFRESLLGAALQRADASAFNPFGYTFKVADGRVVVDQPYRNPAPVLAGVMGAQTRTGETSIASIDVRASGQIARLPAGAAMLGFGGELRGETFSDRRPAYFGLNPPGSGLDPSGNDFIQASPKPDSQGDRTVGSIYAELVAPLVSPELAVPLIRSLETSFSLRHERYSDFGSTTNPKFSFNWRPARDVMVRGSLNRGFSAPNLATLYFPYQYTVIPAPGVVDPYRNPVTGEGPYVMRNYTGARRDLDPSTSAGRSFGLVYDLPEAAFGRLTLSADYWEIRQQRLIGSLTAAQVLERDAFLLRAYVDAQLRAGVPIGQVDLGSGTDAYRGDPGVVRNAVTAADRAMFAAYNARNPAAPQAVVGSILSRQTLYQNLAEGFVSGWDYAADYTTPDLPFGRLRLALDWAVLLKSYAVSPVDSDTPATVQQRLNVDGNASQRASATLSWRKSGWNATLSGYYVGGFSDSGAATTQATFEALGRPSYLEPVLDNGAVTYRYRVAAATTFNVTAGYDFADGARLRLGVVNLANTAPPLASGNFGYSAAAHASLAVGRTWTVELSRRF